MNFSEINPYVRRIAYFKELFPWKWYSKCNYEHRITYVAEGSFKVTLNEKEDVICRKGTLMYWLPGTWYSLYGGESKGFELYAIYFDYTQLRANTALPWSPPTREDYDETYLDKPVLIDNQPKLNSNFNIGNCIEMEKLINEIYREYTIKRIEYDKHISAQLMIILIEALRLLKMNEGKYNSRIKTADRIITYVHDNITEPLNYLTIADKLHFNPNYINHVMKQATGLSFHQYLTVVKVNRAADMIENTDTNITDIALSLGFYNSSHFAAVFKRIKGFHPSALRKHA